METYKLEPFTQTTACPKCGTGFTPPLESSFHNRLENAAHVDAFHQLVPPATPMAGQAYFLSNSSPFRTRYCSGGKEPETEERHPVAVMLEAVGQVSSGKLRDLTDSKRINICAGILQDHLHKTCQNCEYEFLMETKDHSAA